MSLVQSFIIIFLFLKFPFVFSSLGLLRLQQYLQSEFIMILVCVDVTLSGKRGGIAASQISEGNR